MSTTDNYENERCISRTEEKNEDEGWITVCYSRKRREKDKSYTIEQPPTVETEQVDLPVQPDDHAVEISLTFDPNQKSASELTVYAVEAIDRYRESIRGSEIIQTFMTEFSLWREEHFSQLEGDTGQQILEALSAKGAFIFFDLPAVEELSAIVDCEGCNE